MGVRLGKEGVKTLKTAPYKRYGGARRTLLVVKNVVLLPLRVISLKVFRAGGRFCYSF